VQKFWNKGAISGIGGVTGLHELGKRGLKKCRSPCPARPRLWSILRLYIPLCRLSRLYDMSPASDSGKSVTEFGVHGRHMAAPLAVR
jgi:hypothetical protein